MLVFERTSRQWFEDAVRYYEQRHQACPWCGGSHRMFRTQTGTQETFYCQSCDFHAVHDTATGIYGHIAGEPMDEDQPDTMFAE